jgi:tetratricopeptide (TPR) repeat protein
VVTPSSASFTKGLESNRTATGILIFSELTGYATQQLSGHAARQQRDAATIAQQLAKTNAGTAREQTQLALETLNTVIFHIQRGLRNVPGAGEVRRKLLSRALQALKQIADEFAADGVADRQTGVVLNEMADTVLHIGLSDNDVTIEGVEAQTPVQFALALCRRSFGIMERLAASDPTDTQAQRDLSVSYSRLGDVSLQTGPVQEAVDSYRKALDISERLAESDPTDAQAQRDLSVSYEKLGNVSLQTGAVQEAVDSYRKALDIRERLAASDPTDAQAQRDLSVSYGKLGNVSLQTGAVQFALALYRRSFVSVA